MNAFEIFALLQILFYTSSLRCPSYFSRNKQLYRKLHYARIYHEYPMYPLPIPIPNKSPFRSNAPVHRRTNLTRPVQPAQPKLPSWPADDIRRHKNWHLVNHPLCGSSLADRIIGGVNAGLGQYPWMARIGYLPDDSKEISGEYFTEDTVKSSTETSTETSDSQHAYRCGGTLISSDYVITAAHCVTNLPGSLTVSSIRLGEYNTKTKIDCVDKVCADPVQDFKPAQILIHKRYNDPPNLNDIGLIRLERSVNFTRWVSPICLPFGSLLKKNLTAQFAEVTGWGFYDMSVPMGSEVLQTVKLPIINHYRCERAFRRSHISNTTQLCVGGQVGKDSCNGDSGGPLMKVEVVDGPPRYYLTGIVSYGAKYCGLSTAPAVYTNIFSYMRWILNNMVDL